MELLLHPPSALKFTGNVAANWKIFMKKFELYLEAVGKTAVNNKRKIAILLIVAREEALAVYNTFTLLTDSSLINR